MRDSIKTRKLRVSPIPLLLLFLLSLLVVTSKAKYGTYTTVPSSGTYFEEQDVALYDTVAPLIFKLSKPEWIEQFPLFLGYPCNTDSYLEATLCPVFYYLYRNISKQLGNAMEVSSMNLPMTDMDVNFDCDQLSKHFMSFRLNEAKMGSYLEKLRKCTDHKIWEGTLDPESKAEKFRSIYDKMVNRFKEEYHNRLPTANRENKASELNNRLALSSIAYTHLLALGDRWSAALAECKSGFIPDTLVPTGKLNEALTALNNIIVQEIYAYRLSIPFEGDHISRYYKSPLADCVMTEKALYIRVLAPIVKVRAVAATLIKIKSVPFHTQTDVHRLCMIKDFESGRYFNLGLEQTGTIKTSRAMEVTCDTSHFHLCKIPPPLDHVVDKTTDCARALITKDFEGAVMDTSIIVADCALECTNLAVDKFPIVIKSKDDRNTVFIIMNPDNPDDILLECDKKDDTTAYKPPKSGAFAIQIPCKCKVVLKTMEILPVQATCDNKLYIFNTVPFHWSGQNVV